MAGAGATAGASETSTGSAAGRRWSCRAGLTGRSAVFRAMVIGTRGGWAGIAAGGSVTGGDAAGGSDAWADVGAGVGAGLSTREIGAGACAAGDDSRVACGRWIVSIGRGGTSATTATGGGSAATGSGAGVSSTIRSFGVSYGSGGGASGRSTGLRESLKPAGTS